MDEGISLKLARTPASIEEGRLAVLAYLAPFAIKDAVINRLEVVLEELTSNVVRHAQAATYVALSASLVEGGVRIGVEDDGAAFNPLTAQENPRFQSVEDASLGGLGIPLVKRLTRSLDYARLGNVNRIVAVIAT